MDRFYTSDPSYDSECFEARDSDLRFATRILGQELQARGRLHDCTYPHSTRLNPDFAGEIAVKALGIAPADLERANIQNIAAWASIYEGNLTALVATAAD